jgi:hypothetical protein
MTHLQIDQEIRAGDPPRPEDIGKPLAATLAGHHRHAILILDVQGTVRFAATRGMFGRADEELLDLHLHALVPSLPLRATTPGYNIAFVRLAFADRHWHRHRGLYAGQRVFPVEVSIRALPMGRSYMLLAAIREVRAFVRSYDGSKTRSIPMRLDAAFGA